MALLEHGKLQQVELVQLYFIKQGCSAWTCLQRRPIHCRMGSQCGPSFVTTQTAEVFTKIWFYQCTFYSVNYFSFFWHYLIIILLIVLIQLLCSSKDHKQRLINKSLISFLHQFVLHIVLTQQGCKYIDDFYSCFYLLRSKTIVGSFSSQVDFKIVC